MHVNHSPPPLTPIYAYRSGESWHIGKHDESAAKRPRPSAHTPFSILILAFILSRISIRAVHRTAPQIALTLLTSSSIVIDISPYRNVKRVSANALRMPAIQGRCTNSHCGSYHPFPPIKIRMPSVPIVIASSVAAGVGLPVPDITRAEQYWEGILESPRASTGDKATAHAHLVCDCLKAGWHAEMAAQLGLGTAPSVISFGMKLLDARYGEHKEEFGKSTHFWVTVDARAEKRQAELIRKTPSGSEICSVPVLENARDAYKPRYCTKECQVAVNTFFLRVFTYNASTDDAPKDWKSHKPTCKPGLKVPESGTPAPAAHSSMGFCGILERMPGIPGEPAPKPLKEKTKRGLEYSVPVEGGTLYASPELISAQEAKVLAKVLSGSGPSLGTRPCCHGFIE
ncbi:hypothetical protein B0H14DRAFT_3518042 [Mycena olivaceomarginata]|nr:hypothetical protein B0H14DRAFT_3518042 [Mycena olivaceomarginata]